LTCFSIAFNFFKKSAGKGKNAVIDLLTTRTKEQRHEIGEAYKKKENEVSRS
jgi:hypothetical protein